MIVKLTLVEQLKPIIIGKAAKTPTRPILTQQRLKLKLMKVRY